MSLTPSILAYIRQWYFHQTLNQKSSSPACHTNLVAQGDFIFGRSNSSAKETMTPFIIYFLYTFNDIATLRGELTSLLEDALQGSITPLSWTSTFVVASRNSQDNPVAIFAITRVRCRRHDGHI